MTDQEMRDQIRQLESRIAKLEMENAQLRNYRDNIIEQLQKRS